MAYVPFTGSGKFRPDPKPEKKIKEKKVYRYNREPTGELELFKEIWEERPHKSQISGDPLEFNVSCFMHVLAKGKNKYPHFKLHKPCIILATPEEHFDWDNARHNCKGIGWAKIFLLEAELKIEYKKLIT